jgi:hypothetical protein
MQSEKMGYITDSSTSVAQSLGLAYEPRAAFLHQHNKSVAEDLIACARTRKRGLGQKNNQKKVRGNSPSRQPSMPLARLQGIGEQGRTRASVCISKAEGIILKWQERNLRDHCQHIFV